MLRKTVVQVENGLGPIQLYVGVIGWNIVPYQYAVVELLVYSMLL